MWKTVTKFACWSTKKKSHDAEHDDDKNWRRKTKTISYRFLKWHMIYTESNTFTHENTIYNSIPFVLHLLCQPLVAIRPAYAHQMYWIQWILWTISSTNHFQSSSAKGSEKSICEKKKKELSDRAGTEKRHSSVRCVRSRGWRQNKKRPQK